MVVTVTETPTDRFDRLRELALRTINEHADDNGLCAICGCAWPCELVVLAENNLAFVSES